ncbi:hypothetical protein COBT_003206, partial [Conglomerata obtusa]
MYNSTENLLLAFATEQYKDDDAKVQIYIKSRLFSTDTTKWQQNHKNILKQAETRGYSNLIEYCEDTRFTKLIQAYKQKIKLREDILEGRVDPNSYIQSLDNNHVLMQKLSSEEIKVFCERDGIIEEDIDGASLVDPVVRLKEMQSSLERVATVESVYVESKDDLEDKIVKEGDDNPKHEKKYYLRMNESEREFDDFLDKVEEYYYVNNVENENENEIKEIFPILGKVKNKEDRIKLLDKEIKKEKKVAVEIKRKIIEEMPTKRYKRSVTLEDQYRVIMEKVYARKRAEKDKTAWADELKIILKVMQIKLEGNTQKETTEIKNAIKIIILDLTIESSMANTILQILMLIQESFFSLK